LIVAENKKDRIVIQFPLNKKVFKVSVPDQSAEKGFYIDTVESKYAPVLKNGVILLPLKAVAEILNYEWSHETYPAAISPKTVAGVDGFVKNFREARANLNSLRNELRNAETKLANIAAKPAYSKAYRVVGDVNQIGANYLVIRGKVLDQANDVKIKNDEFIYIHAGNSGVLNSRYEASNMYSWGTVKLNNKSYKSYSPNKTVAQVNDEKPVLERIAALKVKIKAAQSVAVKNRDNAYNAVKLAYDNLIEKFPASEIRLRYEQMIHNIKLARGFGLSVYSEEVIDESFEYKQGYSWDDSEAKEDYSRIEFYVSSDYQSKLELTKANNKDKIALLDGIFPKIINSLVEASEKDSDLQLKWIGDLQTTEVLFDDIRFLINTQIAYANEVNADVVLNTAVSPKLKYAGVLALMEKSSPDNSDYDVAYFLTNYSLDQANRKFVEQLKDCKKQIELRFLRYDNSYFAK
jgi:hypothetical protein